MKGQTFGLIIIGTIATWAASGYALYYLPDRGTFGDMFGTVNSLFSGLAFAAIIYTIALQRSELSLQRKELELTRNEMSGQKKALESQSEHMRIQSFEGTFFQLLKLHTDLIDSIDIQVAAELFKGRDSFTRAWKIHSRDFTESNLHNPKLRVEYIQRSYARFWDKYGNEFSHYFRSLYNIIKYIDRTKKIDANFYANIVRAQISNHELVIIFYNCLCEEGEKFKPLVEKYSLLKHIQSEDLGSEDDMNLYSETAFKRLEVS